MSSLSGMNDEQKQYFQGMSLLITMIAAQDLQMYQFMCYDCKQCFKSSFFQP